MGKAGPFDADDVLKYFEGRTPSTCVTCSQSPEARPGVRLCRSCLEVVWTVAEAIHDQEEREALAEADRQLHPNGRCTCCGEGRCDWCRRSAASEKST